MAEANRGVNQQPAEGCESFEADARTNGPTTTDQERGANNEMLISTDIIGKEFANEVDAKSFFSEYARVMGFGLRRHNKRWNTKGILIGRIWVCTRQRFCHQRFLEREDRKQEARPIKRTCYKVEFRIALKDGQNTWVCTYFNGKHNHNLTPLQHVHYIRSHRRLIDADIAAASSLNKVGVTIANT